MVVEHKCQPNSGGLMDSLYCAIGLHDMADNSSQNNIPVKWDKVKLFGLKRFGCIKM